MPAGGNAGFERLGDVVGKHDHCTVLRQMHPRRRQRRDEIFDISHIHDRVVDRDRIEASVQAQAAHIALDMLRVGIEAPADLEHGRRQVAERHANVGR